jgi:SagB-type dehydrogenase family enzyme
VLRRNPNLLVSWKGSRLSVRNLETGKSIIGTTALIELLDRFSKPLNERRAAGGFLAYDRLSVARAIRRLRSLGLLLPTAEAVRRTSHIDAWKQNLASIQYHVATRDIRYLRGPAATDSFLKGRLSSERQPPRFKRYRRAVSRGLPKRPVSSDAMALRRILEARRTVREFARSPALFETLAEIVRGTWGMTGHFEAGVLGRLPAKTSPSAGARHPIECYVIAWNVSGLRPGLYHYDVCEDELRLLRSGDFRKEAVLAASGQRYVARAAFLCIMTAVFERTLWKYPVESAYRVVWLDAGHLAQTFCLLATALGLGPFTTAAIQDSFIEKMIGLDGVKEFPVYLCGAGIPSTIIFEQVRPTDRTGASSRASRARGTEADRAAAPAGRQDSASPR